MMMRAEPAPAASRKRAREKELTQSQRERLDDEKVLKAEKAVKRAISGRGLSSSARTRQAGRPTEEERGDHAASRTEGAPPS